MENEATPTNRKYPQRKRKAVTYYEDFEVSLEEKKTRSKKPPSIDSSSSEDEKENFEVNEIEEDEVEEISEYEKLRLKNLEENRRMMMELGLMDPNKEAKREVKIHKPAVKPKPKVQASRKQPEPTKRSLRLQGKTPEGKDGPFDLFQASPASSPSYREEKARIEEEVLPMSESGDFLDGLKASLSQESSKSSIESLDGLIEDMRKLQLAAVARANSTRTQGMCVHPLESKLLILSGSKNGQLGLWNATEGDVLQLEPHVAPINCITVDQTDSSKVYSTSHDGTVRRADLNKNVFDLVYQTDEKSNFCHITWHEHIDPNTILVAHGTGEAGVVDVRAKAAQRWFHCHPRSIRTLHIHPTQPHYFMSASGIGECKIWDLRSNKKHTDDHVAQIDGTTSGKKGLTSAFFSPDGQRVVSTCNDDFLRFYDTSDLANPKELRRVMHDNHTGRWLSVFKAKWHPQSSDLVFVGSMLQPRRIQLYSGAGRLMRELKDEELTTVCPVIALHPSLPVVVGGNSSGKAHLFTTPALCDRLVKTEDDSLSN